jgi:hypothetical protein
MPSRHAPEPVKAAQSVQHLRPRLERQRIRNKHSMNRPRRSLLASSGRRGEQVKDQSLTSLIMIHCKSSVLRSKLSFANQGSSGRTCVGRYIMGVRLIFLEAANNANEGHRAIPRKIQIRKLSQHITAAWQGCEVSCEATWAVPFSFMLGDEKSYSASYEVSRTIARPFFFSRACPIQGWVLFAVKPDQAGK